LFVSIVFNPRVPIPHTSRRRRGNRPQFLMRLRKRNEDVCAPQRSDVPFTNKTRPSASRMMKPQKKISGGFRSEAARGMRHSSVRPSRRQETRGGYPCQRSAPENHPVPLKLTGRQDPNLGVTVIFIALSSGEILSASHAFGGALIVVAKHNEEHGSCLGSSWFARLSPPYHCIKRRFCEALLSGLWREHRPWAGGARFSADFSGLVWSARIDFGGPGYDAGPRLDASRPTRVKGGRGAEDLRGARGRQRAPQALRCGDIRMHRDFEAEHADAPREQRFWEQRDEMVRSALAYSVFRGVERRKAQSSP